MISEEQLQKIKITPLLNTLRLEKIDDSTYFSEKYSNYISNSRLSLINPEQDNDPQAFFEGLSKHNKYSDVLIFGSAVHQLTLQPESFKLVDTVDRPTAKMGFMADFLYSAYINNNLTDKEIIKASDTINYYKDKMDTKKIQNVKNQCIPFWDSKRRYEETYNEDVELIYLDSKSRERVCNCVSALFNNHKVQKLLHPNGILETPISENEQAILLDVRIDSEFCKPFGLRIKSKLDNYTIDKESNEICINDIKTIGKLISEFNNNIERFHYSREISLYSWLLSLCASKYYGLNNPTIKGNYLVVSTIPSFYTKVRPITRSEYAKGWKEFVYLLKLVSYYVATEYKDFGYEIL